MARESIDTELTVIQGSKYGSQMRAAIHDALFKIDRNEQQDAGTTSPIVITGTGEEGGQSSPLRNWQFIFSQIGNNVLVDAHINVTSTISGAGLYSLKDLTVGTDLPPQYANVWGNPVAIFPNSDVSVMVLSGSMTFSIQVMTLSGTVSAGAYDLKGWFHLGTDPTT